MGVNAGGRRELLGLKAPQTIQMTIHVQLDEGLTSYLSLFIFTERRAPEPLEWQRVIPLCSPHWPRDTQLREAPHRYRETNGVQIMATLRSLAMNALRLDGIWSITEGLAALAHDIPGLPALLGSRKHARQMKNA